MINPSKPLFKQTAVVTGASRGIGKAIAVTLAALGADLCLIGRERRTLEAVSSEMNAIDSQVSCYEADLTVDNQIRELTGELLEEHRNIDILIHSSGFISYAPVDRASLDDLDTHYRTNVRGPFFLTQALLPALKTSRGQVVFINSSIVSSARANTVAFAITQHALKAFADILREEVNPDGVRVLSVFPGRTATPRQQAIHDWEGKAYDSLRLMQPEDVAAAVASALLLPRTAEITNINLRPLAKPVLKDETTAPALATSATHGSLEK